MAPAETPDIRGALRAELIRDRALGELTIEQCAEKYERSVDAIKQFSSRNAARIRRAKRFSLTNTRGWGMR